MSTTTRLALQEEVGYPDSDGEPMAENSRLLAGLHNGFDANLCAIDS
jgi:hypothetical protein